MTTRSSRLRGRHHPEILENRILLSVSRGAFVPGAPELSDSGFASAETIDVTTSPPQSVVASVATTPVDALDPLGSLAFRNDVVGKIENGGDVETVSFDLETGHTIALTIASESGLQAEVSIKDPNGTIVGQATAAAAGASLFLQAIPAILSGGYSIEFRGAASTTGSFNSVVYINSTIEEEPFTSIDNNSLANAQDIDAAFIELDTNNQERGYLIGTRGDDLDDDFESGFLNDEWTTTSSTAAGRVFVSNEAVAASGKHFLLMDRLQLGTPTLNEAIWTVDLSTVTAATLNFSHANFADEVQSIPETFMGSVIGDGVSVSEDGTTWYRILDSQLTPDGEWIPVSVDLVALAGSAGINLDADFHIKFQQFDNTAFPADGRGYDAISIDSTPAVELDDWYRFSLSDGESITLALQEFNFSNGSTIELLDSSSNLLATSDTSQNASQVILDFADKTTNAVPDTYYVRVVSPTADYGLLATQGVAFDREFNDQIERAQDITSVGAVLGNVEEVSDSSLSLLTTFAGPVFTGAIPPDPIIAVGPEQIVTSVNSAIAIYDKNSGQQIFFQDMNGGPDSFFGNVGGTATAFDPWIVFDVNSERFFFVAIDVESTEVANLYMAISTDSTPTSGTDWHKYRWNFAHDPSTLGLGTGNHFPDYEKISVTDDAVYISGNYFAIDEGTGVYAGITAFDKTPLLSGLPADIVYQEFIADGFSIFPLDQRGLETTQYFAEAVGNNIIRIHAITDVLSSPTRHTEDIVVSTFEPPVDVPQLGGATPIDAVSERIMSGVWRDGSAWFAHPITDPAFGDGETVARWYEVATNDFPVGTPSLVQFESIDPGPGLHAFYPAIAVNGNGNMGIGFSMGGPNIFAGAGYTGRLTTDPLGETVFPVQELIDGRARYDVSGGSGRNRWGDYSGMSVDPVDDETFWVFNLYANAAGIWSTQVGSFQVEPTADVDFYSFSAVAGDKVTIETQTPFDAPSTFTNAPDLHLEVYDPNGVFLFSDFDSASDGRNASITFSPSITGTYVARVATTTGDGAYVANISGATGADPAPTIVSSMPGDGLSVNDFPRTVSIELSEAVAVDSVSPADLLGDLVATSATVQGSTITFSIDPASNVGDGDYTYSVAAGTIADLRGNGLTDPHTATFTFDSVGIQLLSTTWNGAAIPTDRVFAPGDLTFVAELSEDPAALVSGRRGTLTPGTDDAVLTDVNLGTTFDETFLEYDFDTNLFTATYEGLVEGTYELRLRSGPGAFIDEAGMVSTVN